MTDIISLFDRDRKEALEIVNTGGSIVKFLTRRSELCPLMGAVIKDKKKLGQGAYGAAFEITFPGKHTGRYVVKVGKARVISHEIVEGDTYESISEMYGIGIPTLISFNGFIPEGGIQDQQIILVPIFLAECRASPHTEWRRVDSQKEFTIPSSASLCEGSGTEFAISLLAGSIFRQGISVNFIDVFDFAVCKKGKMFDSVTYALTGPRGSVFEYIFMQMVDTTLQKYLTDESPSRETAECLLIQILHAILTYQNLYEIVHNDLHGENVFLEKITPEMVWRGEFVDVVDYFIYEVDGTRIYLPRDKVPYLVKIADWGLACKYSSPMILNEQVMTDGFYQPNVGKGEAIIPNFYNPFYDPCLITSTIIYINDGYAEGGLIPRIMARMLGAPDGVVGKKLTLPTSAGGYDIANESGRPWIKKIDKPPYVDFSITKTLTDPSIMGKYLQEPSSPYTSIILGTVTKKKLSYYSYLSSWVPKLW